MAVSLQLLQTFRAVTRNRSFSAAARELFTSQPHVSNQIRSLEDHYGVSLFLRSKGKIALTEAGQALYEKASAILDDVDEAERIIRDFRGLRRGSVRIAATSSFGNHRLPGLIADFQRTRSDITIAAQVANTDLVWETLESDEVELAITTEQPPPNRRLIAEPFVADRLVLIAPASEPLAETTSADILLDRPLVLREEGSLTLSVMRGLIGDRESVIAAQLTGTSAVNEAVAAGVGISLVPESSVAAWQQARTISVHRLPEPQPHHDYVLVHPETRFQSAAAQALLAHLRDWADRHRLN